MKTKKIAPIIIILAVAALAAIVILRKVPEEKNGVPPEPGGAEALEQEKIAEAQKDMPLFFVGNVLEVGGNKIKLVDSSGEKTIMMNEKTEILKQVRQGDNFIASPAKAAEIKASQNLMVFYSREGETLVAEKIQILGF